LQFKGNSLHYRTSIDLKMMIREIRNFRHGHIGYSRATILVLQPDCRAVYEKSTERRPERLSVQPVREGSH
jgi:hypothetical protein